MRRGGRAALAVGLLAALACVAPGPVGGALTGLHPSFLPAEDRITWFVCRWPARALRVALHGVRDRDDREAVALALTAWEREPLGLRFDVAGPGERVDLAIRLLDGPPDPSFGGRTGQASSDCDVSEGLAAAHLVRAQVAVARETGPDWRGDSRVLTPEERVGSLIHEIGHALGFSGHARRPSDPMAAAPEVVRHAGRRVLEGASIDARSLRALYDAPRGALSSVPVPRGRTEPFDARARDAARQGWRGPFVRVGQRSARIHWTHDGTRVGELLVPRVAGLLRAPEGLVIVPARAEGDPSPAR